MEPASWCANEQSPIFVLQTCWKRHPPHELSVLPGHWLPRPPPAASYTISLCLMPFTFGFKMQAWPMLQPRATNLLWLENNLVAPGH